MTMNEGSTQQGEGSATGEEKPTIETLMAQVQNLTKMVEATEASKARVLSEAKATKEKLGKTASEKEEIQKQLLLKEGDLTKLLEMERTEKATVNAELSELKQKLVKTQIRSVVQEFAPDAIDLDDLLNQTQFSPILKEAVDLETLTVDHDKAKKFVDEVRKAKSHFFKSSSQPGVVTRKPGTQAVASQKAMHEMDSKELEALLRSGKFQ
jgi:chromosome segregation ATPase